MMDILNLIKSQVKEAIAINENIVGLESVIIHIYRAEQYLTQGKTNSDDHIYTDVIYRTNHAFEGILKEAYTVLEGKDSSKKTPNDIETYFLSKNILNLRVVELLQNYRTKWRNTSTHDYNLFFNHSEAFLAIVSVSAFIHVLLIQILDKLTTDNEKKKIKDDENSILEKYSISEKDLLLYDRVPLLFENFGKYLSQSHNNKSPIPQREVIATLSAFVTSIDKDIIVFNEPSFENNGIYMRPDMILGSALGDNVIVEIKTLKGKEGKSDFGPSERQLLTYMATTKIVYGILLYLPSINSNGFKLKSIKKNIEIGGVKFHLTILQPN